MFVAPRYAFTRPTGTTQYAQNELVANSGTAAAVVPLRWSVDRLFGRGKIVAGTLFSDNEAVTAAIFNLDVFRSDPGVPTNGDNGAYALATARQHVVRIAMDISSAGITTTTDKIKRFALTVPAVFETPNVGPLYGLLSTGTSGTYTPADSELFEIALEIMGLD